MEVCSQLHVPVALAPGRDFQHPLDEACHIFWLALFQVVKKHVKVNLE
jgi:hypothetical protein